jgi:3-oxoadipate enol-lactonase
MLATADQAAHATDRYLPVDGASLRYRDDGCGPAVLLMHGWTLDLEMWEPQVGALRSSFRLVRLDRRGFGLSSGRPSLANDVSDIDSMCRHLGLGCVALIGMSQGARAALEIAAVATTRVACIVLDGPPDMARGAATEEDVPLAHYRELLRAKGIRAVRREWAMHPLVQVRTTDPMARRLLDSMIERYPGTDLLEIPENPDASSRPIPLAAVAAPALIISGEYDLPSRLNAAMRLARRLSRAERAVIPGAGHLPNLDNPDAYNRLVSGFITRHVTAAT